MTMKRIALVVLAADAAALTLYDGVGGANVDRIAVLPTAASVDGWITMISSAQTVGEALADLTELAPFEHYLTLVLHSALSDPAGSLLAQLLHERSLDEVDRALHADLSTLGIMAQGSDERSPDAESLSRVLSNVGVSRFHMTAGTFDAAVLRGFALAAVADLVDHGARPEELEHAFAAYAPTSSLALRGIDDAPWKERIPDVPAAQRASAWVVWCARSRARQDAVGPADVGVEGALVMSDWDGTEWDSDDASRSLPSLPRAPYVRLLPDVEIEPARLAAATVDLVAEWGTLRVNERDVVVLDASLAVRAGVDLVDALRREAGRLPGPGLWIATTDSPSIWDERITPLDRFDGVVQIPPSVFDLRKEIHRPPGLDRGGRILSVSGLSSGGEPALRARTDGRVVPGAFTRFDTTGELGADGAYGRHWGAMQFRAMLERAVRSVADRDRDRRVVVVNSWNRADDASGLSSDSFADRAARAALADALGV
jgi:hypothetical protein